MKLQVGDAIVRSGFNTKHEDIMFWLSTTPWKLGYKISEADKEHLNLMLDSDWIWFRLPALRSELIKCLTQVEL